MYFTRRRAAVLASLVGLVILVVSMMVSNQRIEFSANLDQRPFNIGVVGTVKTLHPAGLNTSGERLLASALYEGLVYYDEKSGMQKPLLAKSWKYSSDGKSLVINLNKNARFHNGRKVKAKDIKDCWENSFSNTKEWSNISLFMCISGSKERLEGKQAEISGIQVINSSTLKISFEKPNGAFIATLTHPAFWIYDIADSQEQPAGTGPFVLKTNQEFKKISLTRNEQYHRGVPSLSGLEISTYVDAYQAFGDYKAGKLDYLDGVPIKELKNLRSNDKYKKLLIEKPIFATYSLGFNMNKEPFAGNYLLRRAINYAIDRKAIVNDIFGGAYLTAKGVIPLGMPGYNKEMKGYIYDAVKSQELLEEAGYPMGDGLKTISLSYNNDPGHQQVAQSIAEQLSLLGINVELSPVEWESYEKKLINSDLTLFRLEWCADYPDADSFLYSLFHSSKIGISNYCSYRNSQVDKVLDAARAEFRSDQERIKLMQRAEEIIVDDAPCLWLFQTTVHKVIGENVGALEVNSMDMIDWYKVQLLKPSVEEDTPTATDGKV